MKNNVYLCRQSEKRGADIYDEEKSKKLLLWLFVLTFVLTGIAGCGTKQKDDQEAASTETAGAISGVDDIVGKRLVSSLEQPVIFMFPIMKMTDQEQRWSVTTKAQMQSRH